MLRDLLVRASAGLLSAAIAISCSHDDKPSENVGSSEQAASLAGAGGAAAPGVGGAPDVGGPPAGGAPDAGGAGGQPAVCDPSVCEGPELCTHCVAGACVRITDDRVCRPSAGGCDVADRCDGSSDTCGEKKQPAGFVCNPIKPNSKCDKVETCNGSDVACPKDEFQVGTVCRPANPKADGCDAPDVCLGDSADCAGDGKVANGTDCTSSNKCSLGATCQAGLCVVSTLKTCDPETQCKNAETCNALTGNCDVVNKPDGTICNDTYDCTVGDHCESGICARGTVRDERCNAYKSVCAQVTCDPDASNRPGGCRANAAVVAGWGCRLAAGECDVEDKCDGVLTTCPTQDDRKEIGTVCLAASCGNNQAQADSTCDGGTQCPVATPVTCAGYACDGSACRTECATSADCNADHYCLDNVCEERVGAGKPCESDAQCSGSNPYCADGVCCDTECDKQCEACDVTGKAGTCSVVTGDPHGTRTACKGDGSVCNGVCGGMQRSSCTFSNRQTECLPASCDPATSLAVEQAFCDGAGKCAATDAMDCTPFSCGATACRGNCASDAQCAAGSFCKAGICEELQKPGDKCARDGQCQSGFCTDGVCCDARCDGQCESCGGGTCSPVTGAPRGSRPACAGDDGDDCAGTCDGTRRSGCAFPGGAIVCRDASCDAGVATVLAHCTGAGACAASQSVTCPNGCEGSICAGDACLVGADCKEGERCIAGTCAPQGAEGATCDSAGDCESGFCVDGVCCDRACDGQCEACDGGKNPGICAPVNGAPHGARVPCTGDGSACAGACDGKQPLGCRYADGTVCSPGSCQLGKDGNEAVATVEATCNGTGRCPAEREQACGDVGCDAQRLLCAGECADGSACPAGKFCSAGVCITAQPTGTACQASSECASGFCVDGYCCGSACDDRCAACDVPGLLGKCSPVSGNTHGARPGCQGGGVCGSQCDGKNVTDCAYPESGTACGEPYCNTGTAVAAAACDGAGQCQPGEATACASFACDGSDCSDTCMADADCTRDLQCHESKCVEPFKINAVDQGTCGCKVPGGSSSPRGAWLALVALSLLTARRARQGRHLARANEGLR